MKLLTGSQIREADAYTIKHEPISSIDLMERAISACIEWLVQKYKQGSNFMIFVGPGNNGGDGLGIARRLASKMYQVDVFLLKTGDNFSSDYKINLKRLKDQSLCRISEIKKESDIPLIPSNCIVVDSLFGSGLSRKLESVANVLIDKINNSGAEIIAVDMPSGLFPEDNSSYVNYSKTNPIVEANYTLTFQFPKLAFLFPENEKYVGKWCVLPIGLHKEFLFKVDTPFEYIDSHFLKGKIKIRNKFAHKGTCGHALIISGSYGMMGAAVLSARACLRSGAGLVTAHIPRLGYPILQTAFPEAIVSLDDSETHFTVLPEINKYSAIAIGPGLGQNADTLKALIKILDTIHVPMVIDADALNLLSANKELLKKIPAGSVLTPHPGEFTRLVGLTYSNYERLQAQIAFAVKYKVYLILKGAHTTIAFPDGRCLFNSTGNPGMATGGSGDVLTGVITSFLAQGYPPEDAVCIAVYLHGMAGDIAAGKTGVESLIASDIIENIGEGFREIRSY